jgi:hypothetical protein
MVIPAIYDPAANQIRKYLQRMLFEAKQEWEKKIKLKKTQGVCHGRDQCHAI